MNWWKHKGGNWIKNVTEGEKLPTVPDILGYTSDDGDEDSVYYVEGDILDNRAEGRILSDKDDTQDEGEEVLEGENDDS